MIPTTTLFLAFLFRQRKKGLQTCVTFAPRYRRSKNKQQLIMETSTFLIDCFHLISENTPFCQVPKLKIHRVCVDIDNREKSKVPTMCRDEFRLRNFKLWHPILQDFTHSRVRSLTVT